MAINEHRRFVFEKDDPQLKILLQKLQNCNEPLYKDVLLDIQNLHDRTYREIVSVLPGLQRGARRTLPACFNLNEDAEIFRRHVSTIRVSRTSSVEYFLVFLAAEDTEAREIDIVPLLVMDEHDNVIAQIDSLE